MKILQVHNFYQQPGGEDQVYAAECQLLRAHGDEVEQYSVHNDELKHAPALRMARNTIWNADTYRKLSEQIARFRPDVMHCHNTFPLISPAAYYAAARLRVPVVQTLHNYRLVCPGATLLRDGKICEDCVGKAIPFPGALHGCYRQTRAASAAVVSLLALHRAAGTWRRKVQLYLAPTHFIKAKLVEGGFDAQQILVKPNFLSDDPGVGSGEGGYALYAGRLVPEKGLSTLLRAWQNVRALRLQIAGDGPLREQVAREAQNLRNVTVLGYQPREQMRKLMQDAALLIVPSEWYEGCPMSMMEAMACGTPVVASDIGSLAEIVEEGVTGARFAPGDAAQLSGVVEHLAANPETLRAMRDRTRARFLERYSAEANYPQLIADYRAAQVRKEAGKNPIDTPE